MNSAYKNNIIDNLLEMFNNVIDHANSSHVYVCGQFFPKLIELYHTLNSLDQQRVILDLSNITFLSANLLAVLGCCVEYTMAKRNHKIALRNLHPKIKTVMQKNGFSRYFTWDSIDDVYHSTMSYDIFESTTEHLADFERYLLLNVFSHKNCLQ